MQRRAFALCPLLPWAAAANPAPSAEAYARMALARVERAWRQPSRKVVLAPTGIQAYDAPSQVPSAQASYGWTAAGPNPYIRVVGTRGARWMPEGHFFYDRMLSADPTIISRAPQRFDGTGFGFEIDYGAGRLDVCVDRNGFRGNPSASVYVFADDRFALKITQAQANAVRPQVGGAIRIPLVVNAACRIRVVGTGLMRLYELVRDTRVATAVPGATPALLWVGDSFTEGATATHSLSLPGWMHPMAGLRNVWQAGSGSTGYVAAGRNIALKDRYANDVIAQKPARLVLAMGHNDGLQHGRNPAAWRAAAGACLDGIVAGLPGVPILLIGPFQNKGTHAAAWAGLDGDLKAMAAARRLPYVSPREKGWITGDGNAGAPNRSGNADRYVNKDGVHYTEAGYQYIASRLVGEMRALGFIDVAEGGEASLPG